MGREGKGWRAWMTAARPAAHPMIALPLLLGQALAWLITEQFSWYWLFICQLFGVLIQMYSLYLNDYADEAVDRLNQTYWLSGGSRVIPDGQLQGQQLYRAAVVCAGLTVLLSALTYGSGRNWMPALTGLAIFLGWSYSMPPLQASYRGSGELHQAFSCGVTLPVIGFYLQSGNLGAVPWLALTPLALVFFASNIVTALPDIPADTQGGKRSYPVRHGAASARTHALLLSVTAVLLLFPINSMLLTWSWLVWLVVGPALALLGIAGLAQPFREADTVDPGALKRYMSLTMGSHAWLLLTWTILLFSLSTDA